MTKESPKSSGPQHRLRKRRRWRIWLTLISLVGLVGGSSVLLIRPGGGSKATASRGRHALPISPSPTSAPQICPLTDEPASGGIVPSRPALAVKIDNLEAARPQAGLDNADIVYEEPVEGGITRFVAIFQCSSASDVGPIRSARLVDPDITAQFGRALFAYSGGIGPAIAKMRKSTIYDVGFDRASPAYSKDPKRLAPHNLAASTATLWDAGRIEGAPQVAPSPLFQYGQLTPETASASVVHIPFSPHSDVDWTWDPKSQLWLRSYLGPPSGPAMLSDGNQISAANLVVQRVLVTRSPYVEDATGVHENYVGLVPAGQALVYRSGRAIVGTWSRASLADATQLLDNAGQPIPLAPGMTWVELVPTAIAVTAAP